VKNTGSFAYDTQNGAAGLEFPKGSGKTVVFAAGPWLGALVGGQLRVAVSEYSDEYGPGSIVGGVADDPTRPEYKVYKLFRSYATTAERDAALADYNAGAVPHGAPVVTVLVDGTLGIRGDQMLWCVFNDADASRHTNLLGRTLPLGVEVQLTAFAYAPPAAGPASRTVFLHYKFLNKGANTLQGLYLGMWTDPDLGGATDDLVASDPARGLGYVYNSSNLDAEYGSTPPAVGFDLLHGPVGAGGTPLGASAFAMYPNGGGPASAGDVYNMLQGLSATGTAVIDPTTGLATPFWVPGDPVAGTGWIDTTPSDKRMLLSTGPVDMLPGQVQELDYAIVIGQGINRLSSVLAMRCDDDADQAFFDRSFAPPLPVMTECDQVVNCPRPANYWYQQFSAGGVFSPVQLAEIATRVDAASLYLEWSADPVANLRHALNPASAVDPLSQAIREFAAFQCNLAVSAPPVIPSGVPPVFLDRATPVSCPGLAASSINELAATAVVGLSDAAYLDVGPNPPALTGVPAGLPLWGGAAGYAADLFGSSIPSGTNAHTVEIRFTGGAPGQYAYRYLRTLDSGGGRVYMIQDYVPVPWTVWDIDTNTQLNGAFIENAGPPPAPNLDGAWDPSELADGGREIVWAMDSPYSGDATPDPRYLNDPSLQDMLAGNVDLRYAMWPRLTAAGAVIDNGDRFRWTWGGVVSDHGGVDAMLFHLAGLPPGDPAAVQGYGDIAGCLSSINSGFGIGQTCDVPTPVLVSLAGTEVAPDHVTIQWFIGGSATLALHLERRVAGAAWAGVKDVLPDGRGMIEFRDTDVVAGQTYDYRLRVLDGGQTRLLGQVSVTVPLGNALGLEGFHPNPAGRDVQLAFTLKSREPATLAVFDLAGRRLYARDVGALGAGRHVIALERGTSLPSGIYMLQLTQGGHTVTRRAAAIR